MPGDIYNRYKIILPAQGRIAMEGMGKLVSSIVGCSNNTLPTNSEGTEVVYPKGTKLCYQLNGSNYPVVLLEDMRSDLSETLGEFENGRRTMLNNSWLTDMSSMCRDELPGKSSIGETEDDEDEYED